MNIKLSPTISLQFSNGFWNIEKIVEVDSSHHLAKNDTCTEIDNYGDLNRCITALNRYPDIDEVTKLELRKTYINILKDFKGADTFKFENRIRWSVEQGKLKHTVETNKNHHGYMVNYTMKTSHGKSTSGISHKELTANSHANAAEALLSKIVANDITTDNFDDFINTLKDTANNIVSSLKSPERL